MAATIAMISMHASREHDHGTRALGGQLGDQSGHRVRRCRDHRQLGHDGQAAHIRIDTQAQKLAADIKAGHDVSSLGLDGVSPEAAARLRSGILGRTQEAMAPGLPNRLINIGSRIAGYATGTHGAGIGAAQLENAYANKLYENVRRALDQQLASPAATRKALDMYALPTKVDMLAEQYPLAARAQQIGLLNYFAPQDY